ncbi:MAG TPA: AarF/UbiB family protein [Candidatus Kapabacteria bacterium]|nr:AarF/UbiB family protein [Candidatus Kapabacteria bacterium]
MGISLKPEHLKRYKDLAVLAWKHGRSDIVTTAGLDELLDEDDRRDGNGPGGSKAAELADDLERMGPIFIKLGQVLSSRTDILPPEYVAALSRLQDNIEPFDFGQVEQIVQEELGVRISKAFESFEATPLAAASLGQVHRARMRDGREVVVKVQRPGIRRQIAEDLEALAEIAEFLDRHTEMGQRFRIGEMLDQFRTNLVRELDYRQELRHLQQLSENLRGFDRVLIPAPHEDYSTSRVLTMDFVRGTNISSLGPLAHLERDMKDLAEQVFRAYMKQILVDGIFHADPHPGNVLLTHDGKVALIDLGMVGHLSPSMQSQMLKLLLAISEGRSDEAAEICIELGERLEEFNRISFKRKIAELVAQQQNSTVQEIQIGRLVLEVVRIAGASGIRTPPEFTMLGKTLLNLDEVGRTLDPKFDPNDAIRRNAAEVMRQRLQKSATPGNLFASAIEMREFVQELPGRVNRILDKVANDQLRIDIEAIDENALIEGFQKVANRITVGLVLAALIIGAALLMDIQTSFTLFGYPGLAIIFFLLAATGGLVLVFNIFLHDRRMRSSGEQRARR